MVQSLHRAFRILEVFAGGKSLALAQIVAATDLPKATVHRLVRALVDMGYLRQDPGTKAYALGTRMIDLARHALDQLDWKKRAQRALEELCRETSESTYLGVLAGEGVLFIDEVASSRPVRVGSAVGLTGPLHATAAGKAILAAMPHAERLQALDRIDYQRYTPRTIRARDALLAALREVDERGYAVNDEEWHEEACYVAAAIPDATGVPLGAISVGIPAHRLTEAMRAAIGAKVRAAARSVAITGVLAAPAGPGESPR